VESAPTDADPSHVIDARTAQGAGGGETCCQPSAAEYLQPQGTYSTCAQPSGVGSQHIGVPGSGVGGPGSAAATAVPPDSNAAAMPATIIDFIFMHTILLGSAVFVKLKRQIGSARLNIGAANLAD
jgi:hypothetical protein